jgi:hypothetical protein
MPVFGTVSVNVNVTVSMLPEGAARRAASLYEPVLKVEDDLGASGEGRRPREVFGACCSLDMLGYVTT